ncbi:DUF2207 family protein [Microcella humidisoli]|uniref:DUF2207 domain-containing protein n=1 Tax=Microcella humidisoli TaxID=2963406 RepID=A0ABY5FWD2_9MICO|nr:DUF2207 domain-containing protein [Microcella humidisoli]UTT62607.1 DUF2207 domain-containing protein [Microcella humidisoli]
MRRLLLPVLGGAVVLALVIATLVLALGGRAAPQPQSGAAPVTAAPLDAAPAAVTGGPLRTGVDDFTFDSFDVEYRLGRDAEGHATLVTTETLVARFPDYDQNRGIRRSLPATYQGHTTQLTVLSVTDGDGQPRRFDVEYGSGIVDIIAAVPEGQFVRGEQTYVITYAQRDVVDFFASSNAEEFYWNLTGTDWAQPFARVSGTVVLDDGLRSALLDQDACYRGYAGSTERCAITRTGHTFTIDELAIGPYQTVTIAIGFAPGTFTLFDTSYLVSPWGWLQLLAVLGAVAAAIAAIVLRVTRYRNAPGRPVIVAEYLPPRGMSLLEAAVLTRHRPRAVASQLVDFAVRGVLTIIETPATWFRWRDSWMLRLESTDGVDGEERNLLQYFFPGLIVGTEHALTAQNTSLSQSIQAQLTRMASGVIARGWRYRIPARHSVLLPGLATVAGIGVFTAGIVMSDEGRGGDLPWMLMAVPIVAVVVIGACLWRSPLTPEGAELVDHLKGLEVYIELAEADRMRVLQSPEGAEREPVDATSRDERLKLVERLLAWAVLTKHEREWAKELGEFYAEGEGPRWFSSSRAFSVAGFTAGVGSVSSTLSSSYSGSSSSGGSSGGGSSGGGGGGGGGGGV